MVLRYTHMHACIHTCMYMCVYNVCLWAWMYMYEHVCSCMCVHECASVSMFVRDRKSEHVCVWLSSIKIIFSVLRRKVMFTCGKDCHLYLYNVKIKIELKSFKFVWYRLRLSKGVFSKEFMIINQWVEKCYKILKDAFNVFKIFSLRRLRFKREKESGFSDNL